jgi:hypothetical protein
MNDHSPSTRSCSSLLGEPTGALHRLGPPLLDDRPHGAEPGHVAWAQQCVVRVPSLHLGLPQRHHVDAVDAQAPEVAVDVHALAPDATHHHVGRQDIPEPGAAQVDVVERRAGQVLAAEVDHAASIAPPS